MSGRYDTSDNPEALFQPGSNDEVLLNKLAIVDPQKMNDVEVNKLDDLTNALFEEIDIDQQIHESDICSWHKRWLGDVYSWAGQYRTVTMSKDGFPFAAVPQLPTLMKQYEKEYLKKYTPCNEFDDEKMIEALAICHVELIIIHPFRDGNGRISRMLAIFMALQAGKPPLNFTYLTEKKDVYIKAIHAGFGGDYEPMKQIFKIVLEQSLLQSDDE